MNIIQLPRFEGKTEQEQIEQIEDFLFQLVQQYNLSMSDIDRRIEEAGNGKL